MKRVVNEKTWGEGRGRTDGVDREATSPGGPDGDNVVLGVADRGCVAVTCGETGTTTFDCILARSP